MDPAALRGLLGEIALPRWAMQPDVERTAWLNAAIQQVVLMLRACVAVTTQYCGMSAEGDWGRRGGGRAVA